jgi:hypothetical protein
MIFFFNKFEKSNFLIIIELVFNSVVATSIYSIVECRIIYNSDGRGISTFGYSTVEFNSTIIDFFRLFFKNNFVHSMSSLFNLK